jgi:predicted secreted protein
MPTSQENLDALSQNLEDIAGLADQLLGLIKAKDDLAADLRAKIDALVAGDADVAAKVAAAFAKSEDAENKLRSVVPGVPPIGGTPLLTSYPDKAAFDAAVAAYTGPEGVTLDGASVKDGTSPTLDYFTQDDGSVSTTSPAP